METQALKKPPQPEKKHWLLKHSKGMMDDILAYLDSIHEECGDVVHLTAPVAAGEMYVLFGPDDIKHVMVDNQKNYRKGGYVKILQPLFGKGLLTNEGEFWKKQRRLIQPTFHKDNVYNMLQVIGDCVDEMIKEWDQTYESGQKVNLTREFNHLALRVVTRTLFKTDIDDEMEDLEINLSYVLNRFMNRFKNPIVYASKIPTPANRKEKRKTQDILAIVEKIIEQKKKGTIPHQNDILDMLLAVEDEETGERMSDVQIRDELMTILLAGHETTALAMSFMMYHLVSTPDIYSKADEYISENRLTGGPAEIRSAEYIRQVAMETLRISPPAFFYQRQAINDDNIKGFHVPAGMNIALPVFHLHRLKQHWESPELFNPDRFESQAMKSRHKYAYMPFGGGPRLCIGDQFAISEMMIALIKIQNKFFFKPDPNYQLEYHPEMSLRSREPVELPIVRK